jgi:GNAT superfamily N-acetyltransferase
MILALTDLFTRGVRTFLASWEAYADGTPGAALERGGGVAAAVFADGPERAVYNNAWLDAGLDAGGREAAIAAMEDAYAAAAVERFAAWVHETDAPMRAELVGRGYRLVETTRAMGMALDDLRVPRPPIAAEPFAWPEYWRTFELPPDFLAAADLSGFRLLGVRVDGEPVAASLAFDCDGDCGIFNVGTIPTARRRGLATALTALQLHDAAERGCETASLQSTPMAERVYAAVGFEDLGRILEYAPPDPPLSGPRPARPGSAAR